MTEKKLGGADSALAAGVGAAGLTTAMASSSDIKRIDDWIAFHEPKINLIQARLKEMDAELQDKVSFAMV